MSVFVGPINSLGVALHAFAQDCISMMCLHVCDKVMIAKLLIVQTVRTMLKVFLYTFSVSVVPSRPCTHVRDDALACAE